MGQGWGSAAGGSSRAPASDVSTSSGSGCNCGKAKERIDRIEEGVRTKVPQKSSWVPSTVPDESL